MAADFIKEFKKNFKDKPTEHTEKIANAINSVLDSVILGLIPTGAGPLLVAAMAVEFKIAPLPDGIKLMNAIGIAIDTSQKIYVPSMAAFSAGTIPSKLKAGSSTSKSLIKAALADWVANKPPLLDPFISTVADTIANAYPQSIKAIG